MTAMRPVRDGDREGDDLRLLAGVCRHLDPWAERRALAERELTGPPAGSLGGARFD